MKKFIKIILGVIAVFVVMFSCAAFYITRGLKSGSEMTINHVNVSQLEDGVYRGKYTGGRWSNEVDVTIKNKKITTIDVVKSKLFEKSEMTTTLIDNVIKKQDTYIDVVSGATVTTKAYLKSIENALTNKQQAR